MNTLFHTAHIWVIPLMISTVFTPNADKVNYRTSAPSQLKILFNINNPKPMITQENLTNKARNLIINYGKHLQNGNTDEILKLYAPDAEIIPDGLSSLSNIKNIESFYKNTFQTIKIHGELQIKEVTVVGNMALVRCEEPAEVEILSTGKKEKSYFRELFVLQKDRQAENWKIKKYMFSQVQ